MESKIVYDVFHLVYWDWRVALDLFLGGLGVGAFLFAISVMFYRKNDQLVSVKVGSILGPIAMGLGLLLLFTEMGQPLRIYKTLTGFNLTSTMSWGGILQEGFILLSAIFTFLLITNKNKHVRDRIAIFAGLFAVFVAWYHGFLLAFVTARPLWNDAASSVASILISIATGIAAVLLLISFSAKGREEIREISYTLKKFLLVLLLIQMSTFFVWILSLIHGKADFVNAYHILNQEFGLLLWVGAVLIGLILPFLTVSFCSTGQRKNESIPVRLTSIPILIGGYIFKYVLVLAGQIS